MRKLYVLLFSFIIFTISTKAQVTGVKNIPTDYPTLAAAIADLNTNGVGAGGATINLPAGYSETAPTGGFVLGSAVLNASLSAANQLTFQKSGAGANPVLNGFVGTSTSVDGIFILQGTDYVTIDGINLNDPNTGTPNSMEWGYALLNLNSAAPFDGCQNVTIKNCTITLNRLNPNGSFGIYANHHVAANTTGLTLTATGDLHSNNKFYSNNISNVGFGIFMAGFNAASPYTLYDQNNDVGGTSAATGNSISNFGNVAGFNCFGVYMAYHNGENASYNTITGAAGATASPTALGYGIYFFGTNANATANNNTISASQFGGMTGAIAGVYGANTGSLTATNNSITLSNAGASGTNYGVYTASATTTNINNNTFNATTSAASTSTYYLIYNATTGTTETINNNVYSNVNLNTTSTVYFVYASNSTTNVTISGNQVNNYTRTNLTGTTYCIYNLGGPASGTSTVTNNSLTNFSIAGTASTYGIYYFTGTGHSHTITGNTVSNWNIAGAGQFYGIYCSSGATNNISNNTVSNITSSYSGTDYCIYAYGGNTGTGTVSNNTITGLTNGGPTIYGLYITMGAPTAVNVFKNKISNITSNGSTGVAYGMYVSTATTLNIYNNLIGNITTPSTTNLNGSVGLYISGGTTVNAYYNSIYLNGTSTGSGFGSSGIYASTTPTVTLRNNLVTNQSFATGTSKAVAYRRSSTTLTTYGNTSNNNMWYSGGNANSAIFYDGTNTYTTLAAFQTAVAPRDANSVTEPSTPFLSTTGTSTNFLHISTTTPTVVESGGANIASYTDDYDGDTRNATTPDIGADEFSGIAASGCSGTPTPGTITGNNNICVNQATTLTVAGFTSATGISIQWQSSTTSGGPYTNIAGATGPSYYTGALALGTYYYVANITCSNGGASAITPEYTVTVNGNPTISVTPSSPSICLGGSGVSLTASGGISYTWSPATGLSATTGATVTANPIATTTYTVTGANAAGCSAATNVTVTVNAPPTVSATANPAAVCLNGSTQLSATGTVPGNVTSYAFTAGTGATLDPMTGATTAIGTGDDDTPVATPANIGFNFTYEGVTYTQFSASPDGWIKLGGGVEDCH